MIFLWEICGPWVLEISKLNVMASTATADHWRNCYSVPMFIHRKSHISLEMSYYELIFSTSSFVGLFLCACMCTHRGYLCPVDFESFKIECQGMHEFLLRVLGDYYPEISLYANLPSWDTYSTRELNSRITAVHGEVVRFAKPYHELIS